MTVQADPSHKSRGEDSIIAWTWKAFVDDPSDPEILLRLPMTKVRRLCSVVFQHHQFLLPLTLLQDTCTAQEIQMSGCDVVVCVFKKNTKHIQAHTHCEENTEYVWNLVAL